MTRYPSKRGPKDNASFPRQWMPMDWFEPIVEIAACACYVRSSIELQFASGEDH